MEGLERMKAYLEAHGFTVKDEATKEDLEMFFKVLNIEIPEKFIGLKND